jgi:prepilin-type processing-associated H-X9-DG protein
VTVTASSGTIAPGTYSGYGNGFPNTFLFQIRPLDKTAAQCPAGVECCNRWTAQTAHHALNVAMADGSVRAVDGGVSQTTWMRALLPRDGNPLDGDW